MSNEKLSSLLKLSANAEDSLHNMRILNGVMPEEIKMAWESAITEVQKLQDAICEYRKKGISK
jgi:hypothetical protein